MKKGRKDLIIAIINIVIAIAVLIVMILGLFKIDKVNLNLNKIASNEVRSNKFIITDEKGSSETLMEYNGTCFNTYVNGTLIRSIGCQ